MRPVLEELDKKARKKKRENNQSHDLLTAATAITKKLTLVTNDPGLRKVVQQFGGCAIDAAEFGALEPPGGFNRLSPGVGSKVRMSEDEKVELVLKVAKAGFFAAIERLAVIEVLEAGNVEPIHKSVGSDGAGLTAEIITKSLFARLLIGVMVSYDPICKGDYHLKVGLELISEPGVKRLIVQRGGSEPDLNAAEQAWAIALIFLHWNDCAFAGTKKQPINPKYRLRQSDP